MKTRTYFRLGIYLAFFFFNSLFAMTVQIGNGNDFNDYETYPTPYGHRLSNARVQYIYKCSEINLSGGGAGQITALGFNVAATNDVQSRPLVIKLGHTSLEAHGNNFMDGLTTVFSVQNYAPAFGWNMHEFDLPFVWDGVRNLLVDIYYGSANQITSSNASVYYTPAPGSTAYSSCLSLMLENDPYIEAISEKRANIRFEMPAYTHQYPPHPAQNPYPQHLATHINYHHSHLSWTDGGGIPTGFKLYFGENPNPPFYEDLGDAYLFQLPALQPGSQYYWKVVPYNANGDATNCPIWSFSTTYENTVVIGEEHYLQRFPLGTAVPIEYSASLYTAEEIGLGHSAIHSLAWYATTESHYNFRTKIYLKSTTATELSPCYWSELTQDADLFYNVMSLWIRPGIWNVLELDEAFILDEGENLLVLVERLRPGVPAEYDDYDRPGIYSSYFPRKHYVWGANHEPPANDGTNYLWRPNIMINASPFIPSAPPFPALCISPRPNAENVNLCTKLNWANGGGATQGYKLYFGQTSLAYIGDLGTQLSWDSTHLEPNTTYHWKIVPYNDFGDALDSPVWSFTTTDPGTVFIGNGHAEAYLPVFPHVNHSFTQSIFLQSEINVPDQAIEKIAYYWNGNGSGSNSNLWKIYMGHTNRDYYDLDAEWIPVPELIQVFEGLVPLGATAGWVEILLDTPFAYNDQENLLIAVNEYAPGHDGLYDYFYSTRCSTPRSMASVRSDVEILPESYFETITSNAYPNLRLGFTDLPQSPVLEYSPRQFDFGEKLLGFQNDWKAVMICNNGSGNLYLEPSALALTGFDADQFQLDSSQLPVSLGSGQRVFIPLRYQPLDMGSHTASLEIFYNGESFSLPLSGSAIIPENTVTIGDQSLSMAYPFHTLYKNCRSQIIYTKDELLAGGALPNQFLERIAFDLTMVQTQVMQNFMIRIKHSTQDELSSFDADAASFSVVFAETTGLTDTGWRYFELSQPFMWNGVQNLLIDISFSNSSYSSSSQVRSSFKLRKTWVQPSDRINGAVLNGGFTWEQRPNIRMVFSGAPLELPQLFAEPAVHDFDEVFLGVNKTKEFHIYNIGGNTLEISNISISGNEEFSLSNLPAFPVHLSASESLSFILNYSPLDLQPHQAVITITDQLSNPLLLSSPNHRDISEIAVSGSGSHNIHIGKGTHNLHVPLDFVWEQSLYETIYTQEELGNFTGKITSLSFYNNFENNMLNKATIVWLGSCVQDNLSAGWVPASQLTQVFNGVLNFPSGENEIVVNFSRPYLHLDGGNLIMMVYRPRDDQDQSWTDFFRGDMVNESRSRYIFAYAEGLNPYAPGNCATTGTLAKIKLSTIPMDVGSISGRVTDENNQALANVRVYVATQDLVIFTDAAGEYEIPIALCDDLQISFSLPGYESAHTAVLLANGEHLNLDITLHQLLAPTQVVAEMAGAGAMISWQSSQSALRNSSKDRCSRVFTGYMLWRLSDADTNTEANWICLTPSPITELYYLDESLPDAPDGIYKWAVKSVYSSGESSIAVFSNTLIHGTLYGSISGLVTDMQNQTIPGAMLSVDQEHQTTTDENGHYFLSLVPGLYSLTASATNYHTRTIHDIAVFPLENTTMIIQLESIVANEDELLAIIETGLAQNYPNPFNPTTTISYSLKEADFVVLDIYNILGQLVRRLYHGEQTRGKYNVIWDGKDSAGVPCASGLYFCRMKSSDIIQTRKMLMMK